MNLFFVHTDMNESICIYFQKLEAARSSVYQMHNYILSIIYEVILGKMWHMKILHNT